MDTDCKDGPIEDRIEPFDVCSTKKQFLELQERINEAKVSDVNSDLRLATCILDQAELLSESILDIRDQQADIKCCQKSSASSDMEASDENKQQLMLRNSNKLGNLLEQLDQNKVAREKKVPQKKALNPFSKCFFPKNHYVTENKKLRLQAISDTPKISSSTSTSKIRQKRKLHDDSHKIYEKLRRTNEMELKLLWNVQEKDIPTRNSKFNIPLRPPVQKDESSLKFSSVWSVCPEDKKLLSPRVVRTQCGCPPAFGFNIPLDFFGNPFNLKPLCSEHRIHAGVFLGESKKSEMEDIPAEYKVNHSLDFLYDSDWDSSETDDKLRESRLMNYRKTFEKFVSEICSFTELLQKTIELDEGISSDEDKGLETKCESKGPSVQECLKNEDTKALTSDLHSDSLHENNLDNDLLNNFSRCTRLCQWYFSDSSLIRPLCNPPCSVWCDSKKNDKLWGWNKSNVEAKLALKTHFMNILTRPQVDNMKLTLNQSKPSRRQCSQESGFGSLDELSESEDMKTDIASQLTPSRSRHSSGDSGYAGSLTLPTEISLTLPTEISLTLPTEISLTRPTEINQSTENVVLNDWFDFESSYWTPLPECIPHQSQDGSILKNQSSGNAGNRRSLKTQKPRSRNQASNESTERVKSANMKTKTNFSKLRSQQGIFQSHWRLKDSDFPTLH